MIFWSMPPRFVGRDRQLAALQTFYNASDTHLATLRGRRRVGKSRLLLHSLEPGRSAYHQAAQLTPDSNFGRFREDMHAALHALLPDELASDLTHATTWRPLLLSLAQAAQHLGRLSIVIDEFPYLTRSDPTLESVLQEVLGRIETLGQPLKLVLCGSSISQMEALLEHSSPLFGRSDLNLTLHPMDYLESAAFTPAWSPTELLHARTVFGGMPRYLSLLDDRSGVGDNYERLVLDPDGALHEETTRLLNAELSEPRVYASILMAVSQGRTKAGEIITAAGLPPSSLQKYLERLEELGLVQRRRSVNATPAAKNLRYRLADPFIASWHRYALPHLSALRVRGSQGAWARFVAPTIDLDPAAAPATFEDVSRAWVARHMDEFWTGEHGEIGTLIQGSGQQAAELDVACALGRGQQRRWLLGECKWQEQPVDHWALRQLQDNAARHLGAAEVERWLLFSRAGFHASLTAAPHLRLVTLDELYAPATGSAGR